MTSTPGLNMHLPELSLNKAVTIGWGDDGYCTSRNYLSCKHEEYSDVQDIWKTAVWVWQPLVIPVLGRWSQEIPAAS